MTNFNDARTWIVERVSTLIDNVEGPYNEATERACRAVVEDMGVPRPTLYDYREMHAGRGAVYDRRDYASVVGVAITEMIGEWIETVKEQDGNNFLLTILDEVLDLTDGTQRDMFGEHYLPEPDDLETWARENDIDDPSEWFGEDDEDDDENK